MRFYVIRAEWNSTANAENREMVAFDDLSRATAKFHDIMAKDINNPNLTSAMCCVVNSYGNIEKSEIWQREEV